MSAGSAHPESSERQRASMAHRNRGKVARRPRSKGLQVGMPLRVLGTRSWLFMVGRSSLEDQGSLGPSPGCLRFCGRPKPSGPGRQGSSTAHCAGFCATKARPPRRGPPEGSTAQEAKAAPEERGARLARATATTTCPRAEREKLPITQRGQEPSQEWNALQKRTPPYLIHKGTELRATAGCSSMTPSSC